MNPLDRLRGKGRDANDRDANDRDANDRDANDRGGHHRDGRVVFLGLDGVPYGLVRDHPEVFSNLHALAERGSAGEIESIVPPESSACWPALTTGVNPGKTGVYGFQDRKKGSYETYVPTAGNVEAPAIWDHVTDAERDATVLNVPMTYPPSTRIQRQVSGFLSPSVSDAASDEGVRRVLERSGYRIDVDGELGHRTDRSAFLDDAHEVTAARHRVLMHYLDVDDWDLLFGVFMSTDRVNHFLFDEYARDGPLADRFLEFYATVDAYVGEVRDAIDDDTTLVVASDHGFTTQHHEVHCNRWLAEAGWIPPAPDGETLADVASGGRAYSLIPGRFYLNLEGREPDGVVPANEYEAVRAELAADLRDLTGPDGDPVCRRVVTGTDAFSGPHVGIAPDLVVIPTDGYDLKSGFSTDGPIFDVGPRTGMHTFDDAILFTDVPDVDVRGADLYDLAPTMLDLLGISLPDSLEGDSLIASPQHG